MKLRFVASVSHEIRAPLNGITGVVDLLSRSGLNDEQTTWVSDARTSTHQLRQLTDDIPDLSYMEESRFPLLPAVFDLSETIRSAVRAAQGAAQAKGLSLELLMRDGPCPVIGDAQRLTQIVNNLVYNAIKFTAHGSVRVHVEWLQANMSDGNVEVVLSVSDSGRGIAPDALNSIFEPFRQGDDTIKRDFGGTGLGLALCRELSEAMGGSIRVASRPSHGSVFTVVLMLQHAAGDAVAADAPPRHTMRAPSGSKAGASWWSTTTASTKSCWHSGWQRPARRSTRPLTAPKACVRRVPSCSMPS